MSAKKKIQNENIIEGQTKSGVKFKIDKRITEDARIMYYIRNLRKYKDEKDKSTEAIDAMYSLLELMFGSGDGLMVFMNEVAFKHDGVADTEALMQELNEIFDACKLKN